MSWVAVIGAAGAVVGGAVAAKGAKDAAETGATAANQVAGLQDRAARQARSDLQPFTAAGQGATNEVLDFLGIEASSGPGGAPAGIPEIPKSGVATEEDVYNAFTVYMGRPPTNDEIHYYTGVRSNPANPRRQRAGELFRDVVAPRQEKVHARLAQEQAATRGPSRSVQDVQMEFLRNHPLFQMGLENLNEQTNAFAAARGRFGTGDTATEIFHNALAAGGPLLDQRFNQLMQTAVLGQNAAAGAGAAGQLGAARSGEALLGGANARMAGIVGRSQAFGDTLSGVFEQLPTILAGFQNRNQPIVVGANTPPSQMPPPGVKN